MPSAVDYFINRLRARSKYFKNYVKYCKKIKAEVEKTLGPIRVIIFGSLARGTHNPALSDIDLLIITSKQLTPLERAAIINEIKNKILRDPISPFEIHITTQEEYEKWYKKFIDKYIEI